MTATEIEIIQLIRAAKDREAATAAASCSEDEQAVSATLHALVDNGLTDSALRELLKAWESARTAPRGDRTV